VTLEAQIRALADETAPIDGGVSKRLTDLAALKTQSTHCVEPGHLIARLPGSNPFATF
jgi:hypothetical protein